MARASSAIPAARKSAAAIAAAFNKKHGDGTVVIASKARMKPPRLSTGSLALDVALGGGWPGNQWSEIVGQENSGKTTITLMTMAANMRRASDFTVAWIAAESYDEDYAEMLGVDNSRVYLVEENTMEYAYEAALEYANNRAVDMIVIDSLPALIPLDEDEKSMEEWSPGSAARRTNQFMRKATKATKRSLINEDRPIVGVIINQWREKIGSMYSDPRTTPGGKGKNFWMYCRAETRRDEWLYDGTGSEKQKVGLAIKVATIKMKGTRPGPPATVHFYFADHAEHTAGSYDVGKEALDLSLYFDIVERRGNTYIYEDVRYTGGKAGFARALKDDTQLYDRLRKEVLEAARGEAVDGGAPPPGSEESVKTTIRRR